MIIATQAPESNFRGSRPLSDQCQRDAAAQRVYLRSGSAAPCSKIGSQAARRPPRPNAPAKHHLAQPRRSEAASVEATLTATPKGAQRRRRARNTEAAMSLRGTVAVAAYSLAGGL